MLSPSFKIEYHNQNKRTFTWVVPQKIRGIFIIALLKKRAGELEVPSSFFTLMKSLTFFQVARHNYSGLANCIRPHAGVKKVVDLCAAPGSWSQVLSKKLRYNNEAACM